VHQAGPEGKRLIRVGTSTVRLLERVARTNEGGIRPFAGWAELVSTKTLDKLCWYFDCQPGDLLVYVPNHES